MSEWIYGRRAVAEIIKSGLHIKKIIISGSLDDPGFKEIRQSSAKKRIPLETISRRVMDSMIRGNHQGIAASIEPIAPQAFKSFLETLSIGPTTFLCLLDEIQDPQNLGTIIRNAVCFGCSGVIIPKWRSAGLTSAVMKASSGALAHCPVAEISNLGVAVERLKEKGFFIYGADGSEKNASLNNTKLQFPAALLLGNEHDGIKPTLKKACDQLLRIDQKSQIQSLNVASASAIMFYGFGGG